jgi:hypothetical protein
MAVRMLQDGQKLALTDNLKQDIGNYLFGDRDSFNAYVDANYDSSADFWRVIKDGSGKVTKVLDDGQYTQATIVEADGIERAVELDASSLSGQLASAVGGGMTKQEMNDIMVASGLDYNPETKKWFAKTEAAVYVAPPVAGATTETKQGFLQGLMAGAGNAWNGIKTGAAGLAGLVGSWFSGLFTREEKVEKIETTPDYKTTKEQWDKITNPEFYGKYQAVAEEITADPADQLDKLVTHCNNFVGDVISQFGEHAYKDILPYGAQRASELFNTWRNNPNLIQLGEKDSAWEEAQRYADEGYIVLSAASTEGHVAFLLPNWGYKYNAVPDEDWKQRPGLAPPSGTVNYSGIFKKDYPGFLQSGSYTGTISPRWAYSPDLVDNNNVYFFVYKKER